MTTVLVTVAVNTDLPDQEAKEHARWLVERKGLAVERATVRKTAAGKTFLPRAGKPGSTLVRGGRRFQVWSDGPYKGSWFGVPFDPEPGEAAVFLLDGTTAQPRDPATGRFFQAEPAAEPVAA